MNETGALARFRTPGATLGAALVVLTVMAIADSASAHGTNRHRPPAPPAASTAPPPAPASVGFLGDEIALVDHHGEPVTSASYAGRFRLVYFGYTDCVDGCSVQLAVIATAMRLLGERAAEVQPLFVTVDPERDSAERLARYVTGFHRRMVGLTGTPAQIHRAATAFRVGHFAGDLDGQRVVVHSRRIHLVGPAGALLASFAPDVDPDTLTDRIRAAMAARG